MRVKAIIRGFVLSPGELERWSTNKHDFIYIKSNEDIEICYNRIITKLTEETSGLFQCNYGSFSIQNISSHPASLQGIKFSCGTNMQSAFFTTNFDQAPFVSLLEENNSVEVCFADIMEVLEHIKRPQQFQQNKKQIDPRLIKLNRYIRKNYNSPLSLQDLADYVGVHPTYLSNTYSKVFKTSPILFVNNLRMKSAKELLVQPYLSIKDIATIVGYNSLSQFSLIFKRFHSKTPSQYREATMTSTCLICIPEK